ncbi:hypothetical protein KFK09_003642 [Dendrobium nobile]|uniref:Uncharacterized protein n=1 Tax=Dendrobium nobile TaxID=94219 RepID=A0A8T3BY78_DENNO|nr:hypothetical protein KFK09_003642 [Dendrobium nobile]
MEVFPLYCSHCKMLGHYKAVFSILFLKTDVRPFIPEVVVVEVADNLVNGLVEVALNEGVAVNDITLDNDIMVVVSPLLNELGHVIVNVVELGVGVPQRDDVLVTYWCPSTE